MPCPPIFGVEGQPLGSRCVEWRAGPLRACAVRELRRDEWTGVWQVADGLLEVHRTWPMPLDEVAQALELWLRMWLTSIGLAIGVDMTKVRP